MSDNVTKFYPKDAYKDPDAVIEQAIGQYKDVLVLGWDKDGYLDARASNGVAGKADVLFLIEEFKTMTMMGGMNNGF